MLWEASICAHAWEKGQGGGQLVDFVKTKDRNHQFHPVLKDIHLSFEGQNNLKYGDK